MLFFFLRGGLGFKNAGILFQSKEVHLQCVLLLFKNVQPDFKMGAVHTKIGGIPKLLKEAGQVKEALEKMGTGLPDSISVAEDCCAGSKDQCIGCPECRKNALGQ